MIEINLLPWRDYARAQRIRQMKYGLVGVLVVILLVSTFCYFDFVPKGHLSQQTITPSPKLQAKPRVSDAFQKMQFMGYLKEEDHLWGLIKLPNGQIHEVEEGAALNLLGATVKTITEDKMIIILPDKSERILQGN
ncbi:MAG: pilus assembly protein PilP [Gammaproteobacteria bacterium]|nr:pilus assembly protein PilP [Gammaproteobacteria bacterium]